MSTSFEGEDFTWDREAETWKATDGEPFDQQHPRLLGLIVDGCLDVCGSGGTFNILHGHRYKSDPSTTRA